MPKEKRKAASAIKTCAGHMRSLPIVCVHKVLQDAKYLSRRNKSFFAANGMHFKSSTQLACVKDRMLAPFTEFLRTICHPPKKIDL